MQSAAPSLAAVLGTFTVDAGIAWMAGCVAVIAWSRDRLAAWSRAIRERRAKDLFPASGFTAIALLFDLWRRSAEAGDVRLLDAGHAMATMLTATHYGQAWLVGIGALVLIAVMAGLVHRSGLSLGAAIVGLVVLVYTRSIVSHAGSEGDRSVAVVVDVWHLAAVSVWAGVVWVSAWTMRAAVDDDRAGDVISWLRMLSVIATIALTIIVLTGLANTWRATTGSLSALWGSTYGITLAAKVMLVLCAASLGGVNRWVFLPRLPTAPTARRAFLVVLRIEAVILAVVTMLAAVLTNLEPPGSM